MFKSFARFLMPPDMPSPLLWGDEAIVRERFGAGVSDLRLTRVLYRFEYPFGPVDVVEFFRQYYGSATRAVATLSDAEQAALRGELVQLWSTHNRDRHRTHDGGCRVSRRRRDARMTERR